MATPAMSFKSSPSDTRSPVCRTRNTNSAIPDRTNKGRHIIHDYSRVIASLFQKPARYYLFVASSYSKYRMDAL